MKNALNFAGTRLGFALAAQFEFVNRLSNRIPSGGVGLSLAPTWAIGWLVLFMLGVTPVEHPLLGGFLAFLAGPAALMLLFFGIGVLLAAIPRDLVAPMCADGSVVDSQVNYGL